MRTSLSWPRHLSTLPFHPFVAAMLIPLNLVAANTGLFTVSDAYRPVILLWIFAAVVLALVSRFLRLRDAAMVTTVLLLGFLVPWEGALAIGVHLGAVVALCLLLRHRPMRPEQTTMVNVALVAMLLVPVWGLGSQRWAAPAAGDAAALPGPFDRLESIRHGPGPLPSIVHIVLDGYGGTSALQSVMGFDNRPFLDELRQLDFVVAPDARVPYNQTLFSMAAIFRGDYLSADEPPLSVRPAYNLRATLGRLVTDGPVQGQLRGAGYRLLFTDTGYGSLRYPEGAFVSRPVRAPNPVELHMMGIYPLAHVLSGVSRLTGGEHYGASRLHRLSAHALATDFYRWQRAPFVLYHHIMAPHPPFNVEHDGTPTRRWLDVFGPTSLLDGDHAILRQPARRQAYREGYLAKLAYVNAAVLGQVRAMIQDIPAPKVIFIHGDHGSGSLLYHEDPERTCLSERFTTLLAVYSDDPAIRDAYAGISTTRPNIINLYRMLFDARFGTELGPLEDRSYFVKWRRPLTPERLPEEALAAPCAAGDGGG